jgi:hypothetical protein
MVEENRARKSPDYRLEGIGPGGLPAWIECKRRLGITKYELEEARLVNLLYTAIRNPLKELGIHSAMEVCFTIPVNSVVPADFVKDVASRAAQGRDEELLQTAWGTLRIRRLPYWGDLNGTRLYSPDFLQHVFSWRPEQDEWDGLICEVEPPWRIAVEKFRNPLCLKWRSECEEALIKKARGVTSLWADAVRQIPDGDFGFTYIAYPEGARPAVADARTKHILEYMQGHAYHRWSVRIPANFITRLFARPVGGGCPDLIENALLGAGPGDELWLTKLPGRVFSHEDK